MNYRTVVPEEIAYELHALDRCMKSQEMLVREIDEANPDDPYASLLVVGDIELLTRLRTRVLKYEEAHQTERSK